MLAQPSPLCGGHSSASAGRGGISACRFPACEGKLTSLNARVRAARQKLPSSCRGEADLQGWVGKAGCKHLLKRPLQLGSPVQLSVGCPVLQSCSEGIFSCLVLQPLPREQHILQALAQHEAAALVSLLHKTPPLQLPAYFSQA